ncbi:hypothetical protein BX661DRAFT_172950 [Kickxella alabastrina]|uniref:uncharacterized protein n=1 Tax=Kickxella alabastrina TaxID=61397 RepID=UPI00221E8FA4|nr:uncharacterized protein BX661DRAFT_172950 [Kickxella alabastrina]KAI7822785.1 hypothetical protein BX661DRAFT_172950 [Kickxella alabastrina]
MSFSTSANFMFLNQFSAEVNGGLAHGHSISQALQFSAAMSVMSNDAPVTSGGSPYFIGNPLVSNTGNSMYSPKSSVMLIDSQHQRKHSTTMGNSVSATLAAASLGGPIGSDRNRSPSSPRSVSSVDNAQRRATHNAIERARREQLNGQFQDLASAVPSLIHVRRPSKATIVEKSLDYIRSFKEHLGNRDQYIKKLQLRNLALHDEVNRMRKQLGLEPMSNSADGSILDVSLPTVEEIAMCKRAAMASSPSNKTAVEDDDEEEDTDAVSPSTSTAMKSLIAEHRQQQQLMLRKRRQQSLDLGIVSEHSIGRPALRVFTGNITQGSNSPSPVNSGNNNSSGNSPLHISPLSAPILTTRPPQLPLPVSNGVHNLFMNNNAPMGLPMMLESSSAMHIDSNNQSAAAAAAAFVAHSNAAQQQALAVMTSVAPLTAEQFNSVMGMNPSGVSPDISSMQVNSMGYMGQHPGAAMDVSDMNKLNEIFAANSPSTAVDGLSLMATCDMSDPSMQVTSASQFDASVYL